MAPLLSYAQCHEDIHLLRAFGDQPGGFYIDIGAGHPVYDNVSFAFHLRGWRGITVEPNPWLAQLSGAVRPRDIRVASLVGATPGDATYYLVDDFHGLSTTVEGHARAAQSEYGKSSQAMTMPVTTLRTLCEQHAPATIDFLKIDVEGAEADVFAGGDFKRFRPKVIVAEAVAPGSGEAAWQDWEPQLLAQGYRFALFDTLNRFYVAEEQPAIFERLPRERADWHAVRHMYEIGRAPDNANHPDHALARDLARGLWAMLPWLEPAQIFALLARARGIEDATERAALAATVGSEAFRLSLGRIACGYDGGQVVEE
jgi:FkbM family methyltransferase